MGAESKALRLTLHRLSTGELAASVVVRTWGGRETWDRRLLPPRSLGTPPPAPAGISGNAWALMWAACRLLGAEWEIEIRRAAPPRAPGGDGGASAERPIVRSHDHG